MATVVIQKRRKQSGTSYPVYFKDPATGKRKYYKTFQRQRDAQQAANDLRAMLDSGDFGKVRKAKAKPTLMTFQEMSARLIEEWQRKVEQGEMSPKTFEDYRFWANRLSQDFGSKLLYEITAEEVVFYRDLIARKTSNLNANKHLFVFKQVFKGAAKINAVRENPLVDVPYLSEKAHQRTRFISPKELNRLVEACQVVKARFYLPALIYLGAEHGASRQEAMDLKWSDIDFDFHGGGLINFFRQKTGRHRTQFLMPRTREALLAWRKHQEWMRHRKKITEVSSDLVFCRLDGTPIKRIDTAWKRVCEAAGIEDFHFHDLRHTYCSNLLLSGSDLKDVKDMIGHADLSMTDRYSHLVISRNLQRQEKLAEFYSSQDAAFEPSGEHIGNTGKEKK
jgi:integrase